MSAHDFTVDVKNGEPYLLCGCGLAFTAVAAYNRHMHMLTIAQNTTIEQALQTLRHGDDEAKALAMDLACAPYWNVRLSGTDLERYVRVVSK